MPLVGHGRKHDEHHWPDVRPSHDELGRSRHWVDPLIWAREDMRHALAERDITKVYQLLQRFGVSQRRIAARTEQSQSEISEIIAGRRVVNYDVLVRIAGGLGIPRGWMGLAYDTNDGRPPTVTPSG